MKLKEISRFKRNSLYVVAVLLILLFGLVGFREVTKERPPSYGSYGFGKCGDEGVYSAERLLLVEFTNAATQEEIDALLISLNAEVTNGPVFGYYTVRTAPGDELIVRDALLDSTIVSSSSTSSCIQFY